MSWAAEEFKDIDLGDRRLDKRTVLLAERMAANPMASIPQACGDWAQTQAAYRLLAQDDLGWEAILAPHWQSAEARMRAHRVVLCLQGKRSANDTLVAAIAVC
jgi:putative lipase involved disintegration of autophagic bodies